MPALLCGHVLLSFAVVPQLPQHHHGCLQLPRQPPCQLVVYPAVYNRLRHHRNRSLDAAEISEHLGQSQGRALSLPPHRRLHLLRMFAADVRAFLGRRLALFAISLELLASPVIGIPRLGCTLLAEAAVYRGLVVRHLSLLLFAHPMS